MNWAAAETATVFKRRKTRWVVRAHTARLGERTNWLGKKIVTARTLILATSDFPGVTLRNRRISSTKSEPPGTDHFSALPTTPPPEFGGLAQTRGNNGDECVAIAKMAGFLSDSFELPVASRALSRNPAPFRDARHSEV